MLARHDLALPGLFQGLVTPGLPALGLFPGFGPADCFAMTGWRQVARWACRHQVWRDAQTSRIGRSSQASEGKVPQGTISGRACG